MRLFTFCWKQLFPSCQPRAVLPDSAFAGDEGQRLMRGRKVGAEDLQLMLLAMLGRQPSHGYELIKALNELSNGYYKPSPGVIYPALAHLETAAHVSAVQEGSKKRYQPTPTGLAHLAQNEDRIVQLLKRLQHASKRMTWLRQALNGQERQLGPEGQDLATGWLPGFIEIRQELRNTMALYTDASPATQQRIVDILQQAITQIKTLDTAPGACPPSEQETPS